MRTAGLLLLVLGLLALAYGGFSYTRDKGDARIGRFSIEITEKKHVNVPLWAGVGAVAVGAALLARRSPLSR